MIAVTTQLTDLSGKVMPRYEKAAQAGVTASAQTLLNALKRAYNKYYTSQDFRSTLQIRQALRRSDTERAPDGYFAMIGVPTAMVTPKDSLTPVDRGMVALYWELGHHNIFSRRYERVQIAVPAATQASKSLQDTFARVVKRYMEAP